MKTFMLEFYKKRAVPVILFLIKWLLILVGIYIAVMVVSLAIDTPGFMENSGRWSHAKAVDISIQNILLVTTSYIFLVFALKGYLKASYKLSLVFIFVYIPLCIYLLGRLVGYEQWVIKFGGTVGNIFMVVFGLSVILVFLVDIISLGGNTRPDEKPKSVDKRFLTAGIACILVFIMRMIYLVA